MYPAKQKQAPTCRVRQDARKTNLISIEAVCLLLLHSPLGKLEINEEKQKFLPVSQPSGEFTWLGKAVWTSYGQHSTSPKPCIPVKESSPGTLHSSLGQGHS